MKSTTHHLTQSDRDSIYCIFRHFGEEIEELSFLGRGEGSIVYKVKVGTPNRKYCIKMALFPERTQKVLNEAKIREEFLHQGLNFLTPPLYVHVNRNTRLLTHGAVIYDFIEGNIATFDDKAVLSQMARYLAEIHTLNYEVIPDGFQQMLVFIQSLKKTIQSTISNNYILMNDSIVKAFSAGLAEYSSLLQANQNFFTYGISSILHGDLSNNFILDPQRKLWLIDWENSEYGDSLEEISCFIHDNDVKGELREFFFAEYQNYFSAAAGLHLGKITPFYIMATPVFNICWGIDQLSTNICHKLEPERKLRDLAESAKNWSRFFTETSAALMIEGISELKSKLIAKGHCNPDEA